MIQYQNGIRVPLDHSAGTLFAFFKVHHVFLKITGMCFDSRQYRPGDPNKEEYRRNGNQQHDHSDQETRPYERGSNLRKINFSDHAQVQNGHRLVGGKHFPAGIVKPHHGARITGKRTPHGLRKF